MKRPSVEVYECKDSILSAIGLPDPCDIRLEVHLGWIELHIGPSDWVWDRETGELTDTGTSLVEMKRTEQNSRRRKKRV
jgi:hypothetical protein